MNSMSQSALVHHQSSRRRPIGRAADNLFAGLPAESLTAGAKIGVSPAAMGAGYVTFFFYSALVGVAGIVLSFIVAARQPKNPATSTEPETT